MHDNFTMGVNRKISINLIYLFIQETYLTALIIYYLPIIDMYFLNFLFKRKMVCFQEKVHYHENAKNNSKPSKFKTILSKHLNSNCKKAIRNMFPVQTDLFTKIYIL